MPLLFPPTTLTHHQPLTTPANQQGLRPHPQRVTGGRAHGARPLVVPRWREGRTAGRALRHPGGAGARGQPPLPLRGVHGHRPGVIGREEPLPVPIWRQVGLHPLAGARGWGAGQQGGAPGAVHLGRCTWGTCRSGSAPPWLSTSAARAGIQRCGGGRSLWLCFGVRGFACWEFSREGLLPVGRGSPAHTLSAVDQHPQA